MRQTAASQEGARRDVAGATTADQPVPPGWAQAPGEAPALHGIAPWRQALDRRVTGVLDRAQGWMRCHWLLLVNGALALLVGVALLVPLFFALGWITLGHWLLGAYHLICAQIPSHSYYFWGHQVALCERNLAIYGSLFAGSLVFRYVRAWLPPLDWRVWVLTMLPMAWDGGTQLFGWRESNWELRTLTGVLFGLGVCWFALPMIEEFTTGKDPLRGRIVLDLRVLRALLSRYHTRAAA